MDVSAGSGVLWPQDAQAQRGLRYGERVVTKARKSGTNSL